MRILLPTPDYPPMTGGIQLLIERLVRSSRHTYEVITPRAAARSLRQVDPVGVRRTPRARDQRATMALLNAATLAQAARMRPDAVLSGHVVTGPGAIAAQTLLRIPAIQYLHSSELATRANLSRVITTRARASVAVSSYTASQALALGAPPSRVHTILPGVDAPAEIPPRSSVRSEPPTVLTVARLVDRYKGFDVMIEALPLIAARVPGVRWVLVGDGVLREELQAMVAARGLTDRVLFAGAVDDRERDSWFERSDVFAMPSRLMAGGTGGEGFGIVYLEAAARGLPCVAGNVGGATDAVLDGETGVTVDPTDHVAVAAAIAGLLTEPDRRARLGEAGRARAQRLSWRYMAEQVDTLIEGLAPARR